MKIEIKSYLSGEILFAHDCDKNTIKITVEAGVKIKANLRGAYLGCADLGGADLGGAYLGCANLRGADLRGADLGGAYLGCADLGCADLRCADLRCADLRCADLRGADLRGADLRGAYLGCADLGGANLGDIENPISIIKQFGNFGSRNGFTIVFKCKNTIEINCGCFWGNINEFEKRVKEKPVGDIHRFEYLALIDFIKKIWGVK